MIKESATLLDKSEWEDIDLVLGQHKIAYQGQWDEFDSRRAYVIFRLRYVKDDELTSLHAYLATEGDHSSPGKSPFKTQGVRLFLSHLARHRTIVGRVGDRLSAFGVEGFVAHDSIEPSEEWQAVIEAALVDCDAMAVFLHEGFRESKWCDQEVGWALGRGRPMLPLNLGVIPMVSSPSFKTARVLRTGRHYMPGRSEMRLSAG